MTFVLDASVAIAWATPDERDAPAEAILARAVDHGARVPGLWRIEIADVLLKLERRGRLTASERVRAMDELRSLPIAVDTETSDRAWTDTLDLAEHHGLRVYDACYLELALRKNVPLATRDRQLRQAAEREGVAVLA